MHQHPQVHCGRAVLHPYTPQIVLTIWVAMTQEQMIPREEIHVRAGRLCREIRIDSIKGLSSLEDVQQGKCWEVHLGDNSLVQHNRLGEECLESCPAEKGCWATAG